MSKSDIFRLKVAEFMQETRRMGPSVVGAYVRLMLDYYEQGEAPPDDNAVLCRVAGCDPELWGEIRTRLEHLFEIRDGRWYHAHVEAEIEAGKKRMTKSQKAADAAAKAVSKAPQTQVVVPRQEITREELAEEYPPAPPPQADPLPDDDDLDDDEPEPPVPQPKGIVFEGPLSDDFKPTASQMVEYFNEGYDAQQVAKVLDDFRRYNFNAGTTSNNWPELWNRWWNRKKPPLHPSEKPAPRPRVEVSRRRAPPPPPQTE